MLAWIDIKKKRCSDASLKIGFKKSAKRNQKWL